MRKIAVALYFGLSACFAVTAHALDKSSLEAQRLVQSSLLGCVRELVETGKGGVQEIEQVARYLDHVFDSNNLESVLSDCKLHNQVTMRSPEITGDSAAFIAFREEQLHFARKASEQGDIRNKSYVFGVLKSLIQPQQVCYVLGGGASIAIGHVGARYFDCSSSNGYRFIRLGGKLGVNMAAAELQGVARRMTTSGYARWRDDSPVFTKWRNWLSYTLGASFFAGAGAEFFPLSEDMKPLYSGNFGFNFYLLAVSATPEIWFTTDDDPLKIKPVF